MEERPLKKKALQMQSQFDLEPWMEQTQGSSPYQWKGSLLLLYIVIVDGWVVKKKAILSLDERKKRKKEKSVVDRIFERARFVAGLQGHRAG